MNKHLELACKHVSDAWFPVNEGLLRKIQQSIEHGYYKRNTAALINDVKKDFSLFTHCLRKLSQIVASQLGKPFSPVQMLEAAAYDELANILKVEPRKISVHQLERANDEQSAQIQFTMTSAAVAETVSSTKEVNSGVVFSCSLIRQLGLALVAWNYPHVYKRAVVSLKDGNQLDDAIAKVLGFSPTALGVQISRQWRLTPEVAIAIGDSTILERLDHEEGRVARESATLIDKICEVGEAFARATNSQKYPTANRDWNTARHEIQRALGSDGLKLIQQNVSSVLSAYAASFPKIASTESTQPKQSAASKDHGYQLLSDNQYARRLNKALQDQLEEVYKRIDPRAINKEALDYFAREVVPQFGFAGGCVFLIELDTGRLLPRLSMGSADLSRFKAVSTKSRIVPDPIATAFECASPLTESQVESFGQVNTTFIAGGIGNTQRIGVLYLEIDSKAPTGDLNRFKALRQALSDILNVQ